MIRFATTRDFQTALLPVIRKASQANPSRLELADQLETLAQRLGATRKKSPSKKKGPAPVPQRVIVNVGKEEHKALQSMQGYLDDAFSAVEREVREIKEAIHNLEEDAKLEETEVDKDLLEKAWWENTRSLAGDVIDYFRLAVERVADTLEENVRFTQEQDLFESVKTFWMRLPKDYGGDWPEGKGEKLFHDVEKAIKQAIDKVPAALSKASELGQLRDAFDAIADAIKLMTSKSISVPKIPNALDPEDPRQLGFGFSASRRIATTLELKARLDAIWKASSVRAPSRLQLGDALFDVASRLR